MLERERPRTALDVLISVTVFNWYIRASAAEEFEDCFNRSQNEMLQPLLKRLVKLMRESEVKELFLARIERLGGIARKVKWEGRNHAPDWRASVPRYFVQKYNADGYVTHSASQGPCFVELKATGEVPTPAQEREHRILREHGEIVVVIDGQASLDREFPLP